MYGKSNVVLANGSMRMEHRLNMSHYGTSAGLTGANGQTGAHAVHHVTEEKLRERENVFMMGNVQLLIRIANCASINGQ